MKTHRVQQANCVQQTHRVQQVGNPDPRYFPTLYVTFLAIAAMFLIWRTAVVNWDAWYGPATWIADMFGLVTAMMFVISLRRSTHPLPPARPPGSRPDKAEPAGMAAEPTAAGPPGKNAVDILIPTVNEPLSVLEPTVIGAMNVRGARHVLVLDDGARKEVQDMAHRLGARYVARLSNEGAKAGNLNHALRKTDAEMIVTLDADHIPLPDLVEQMRGYFADPDLGFVQTPQSFYNTESFTFRRRHGNEAGWHEQEMFYGGLQPTKNSTNSVIYTGTSAMLRRSAIDSIGGFVPDTPTEDIHTSLRLHARGWRSVYLNTPMAYGLEVENLREYHRTRSRWAGGSLQLLLRHPDSPLRVRGLSPAQRISYLAAMLAHLGGLVRVLYLVAPIAALLTGVAPVTGTASSYGLALLGFLVLSTVTVATFGRGHHHLVHSETFAIANLAPMLAALPTLFSKKRAFGVSVKRTSRHTTGGLKAVYYLYAAANLAGLTLAVTRLARGEFVGIAAWSAAFLALGLAYSVLFLVTVERYERRPGSPYYARLGPNELYKWVVFRYGRPEPVRTLVTA